MADAHMGLPSKNDDAKLSADKQLAKTDEHGTTTAAAQATVPSMTEKQVMTQVHCPDHPVLAHKLTILRSSTTKSSTFRAVLREVTYHLGYEASRRLTTRPVAITVPVCGAGKPHHAHGSSGAIGSGNGTSSTSTATPTISNLVEHQHLEWPNGRKLQERIALIPILRSGLGMVDAMLEIFPNAAIHHIGMYKVLGQNPVQYFNRLPRKCSSDVAFVLDPLIQTSSTIMSVISILKKWGVAEINILSVLASRIGIQQLIEAHPDVYITVGTIDDQIDDTTGFVIPGLGDAGDRLFGLSGLFDEDDDEALLHPSKRKRTMD